MNRGMKRDELKYLVWISLGCFILSLVVGMIGSSFSFGSHAQLVSYSINDTLALAACVLAGRYVGSRGNHVAAAGFVMMGIVHGISAGGIGSSGISLDSVRLVIPLLPSIVFIAWCTLFPVWLRIVGMISIMPFIAMYWRVFHGLEYDHWTTYLAYVLLAIVEIVWGVYLVVDYWRLRPTSTSSASS